MKVRKYTCIAVAYIMFTAKLPCATMPPIVSENEIRAHALLTVKQIENDSWEKAEKCITMQSYMEEEKVRKAMRSLKDNMPSIREKYGLWQDSRVVRVDKVGKYLRKVHILFLLERGLIVWRQKYYRAPGKLNWMCMGFSYNKDYDYLFETPANDNVDGGIDQIP